MSETESHRFYESTFRGRWPWLVWAALGLISALAAIAGYFEPGSAYLKPVAFGSAVAGGFWAVVQAVNTGTTETAQRQALDNTANVVAPFLLGPGLLYLISSNLRDAGRPYSVAAVVAVVGVTVLASWAVVRGASDNPIRPPGPDEEAALRAVTALLPETACQGGCMGLIQMAYPHDENVRRADDPKQLWTAMLENDLTCIETNLDDHPAPGSIVVFSNGTTGHVGIMLDAANLGTRENDDSPVEVESLSRHTLRHGPPMGWIRLRSRQD